MGACLAYWAIFITKAGEKVPAQLAVKRDREHEARLIHNLELLNESLIRSASR